MDDFSIWWYIIAGIIYLLTKGRKKKKPVNMPNEQTPPTPTKSFEELLKEISEGASDSKEEGSTKSVSEIKTSKEHQLKETTKEYKSERRFADEESRNVYEESIKMAEGADLNFEPDDDYKKPSLFKKYSDKKIASNSPNKISFADEIREGLKSKNTAKKAVIYSEILNRKF